jgi:hypothetical protein
MIPRVVVARLGLHSVCARFAASQTIAFRALPFRHWSRAMSATVTSETSALGTSTTVATVVVPSGTIRTTTVFQPNLAAGVNTTFQVKSNKEQDRDAFVALHASLVDEIIAEVRGFGDYDEGAIAWFKEVRGPARCFVEFDWLSIGQPLISATVRV